MQSTTRREADQSNTRIPLYNLNIQGKVLRRSLHLLCGPHVGGHVGVEIAEAVDDGKGQADNEPAQDTEHAPGWKLQ
jgi:hypothetical protein